MSTNCNMQQIQAFVRTVTMLIKGFSGDDSYHGRNEADDKMNEDTSVYGPGLLINITGYDAENCGTEHHGQVVAHVKNEEKERCHPYGKMLVVFFAGCSDVIFNDSLNE